MPNHNEECERCYWRGRAEAAEAERDELRGAMAMVGNAPSDLGRAVSAEAEVARLTTLLEQRTAALTRTIDAKNTAEAKVAEVKRVAQAWADQPTDYDEDTEQQIADGLEILAVIHGHYSAECSCTACRAITRDALAGDQP